MYGYEKPDSNRLKLVVCTRSQSEIEFKFRLCCDHIKSRLISDICSELNYYSLQIWKFNQMMFKNINLFGLVTFGHLVLRHINPWWLFKDKSCFICQYIIWLVGWILWHINPWWLFNAKSCLYIYIKYI